MPLFAELVSLTIAWAKRRSTHRIGIAGGGTGRYAKGVLLGVVSLLVNPVAGSGSESPLNDDERSESAFTAVPSILADYVFVDAVDDIVLDKVRIQLSPFGLRTTETWQGLRRVTVQNFVTHQAWIIDPQRRIFHELQATAVAEGVDSVPTAPGGRVFVSNHAGTNAPRADAPTAPAQEMHEIPIGVMMVETCAGLQGINQGRAQWRGHSVQQWRCLLPDGRFWSTQYFSKALGMVVREVGQDRIAHELRGVKAIAFADTAFAPPVGYRAVTVLELISDAPALQAYQR